MERKAMTSGSQCKNLFSKRAEAILAQLPKPFYRHSVQSCLRCSVVILFACLLAGCVHPKITAYDLGDKTWTGHYRETGMPYYLPKYYLVVSKNIRYIPTPTIGLTQTAAIPNSFDGGSQNAVGSGGGNPSAESTNKTGGGKSGTSTNVTTAQSLDDTSSDSKGSPSGSPSQFVYSGTPGVIPASSMSDGLIPETFYTYQFIALPDLSHKYGLVVKGGNGELRSTLNLVNGWMFTGPGPLYMRDSSSSQNIAATGTAVQQVTDSLAKVASMAMGIPPIGLGSTSGSSNILTASVKNTGGLPDKIDNFANVTIWEIGYDGKKMTFTKVVTADDTKLTRDILALAATSGNGQTPGDSNAAMKTEIAKYLSDQLAKQWTIDPGKITVKIDEQKDIAITLKSDDATKIDNKLTDADLKKAIESALGSYVIAHPGYNEDTTAPATIAPHKP